MTTTERNDCVFCGIVRGTVSSHTLYEDEATLAFLDINPAAHGHTLVVPKRHFADLLDIDADTAAAVMRTVMRLAQHIDDRLAPDGLTLVQTNRPAGWQDVFHLHMHIVPRWDGDELTRPWTLRPAAPVALEPVAQLLRIGQ